MIAYSRHLYRRLLAELRAHHQQPQTLQQKIEAGFGSCYHCWSDLVAFANTYVFTSIDEEIEFFRCIKPRFTALIDYYKLRYHAVLFLPDLHTDRVRSFWEREAERLPLFIDTHPIFIHYYTTGRTDRDASCFTSISLAGEERHALLDGLVGRLLALRRYDRYVQQQLKNLANGNG